MTYQSPGAMRICSRKAATGSSSSASSASTMASASDDSLLGSRLLEGVRLRDDLGLGLGLDDLLGVLDRLLGLDDRLGDLVGGQLVEHSVHDHLLRGRCGRERVGRGGREVLVGHGGHSPRVVSGEVGDGSGHPKMNSTPLVKT